MDGSDKASILGIDSKIVDAIKAIEDSQRRIALVLSDEKKLLGTLTDGDIRRCLLSNGNLETLVSHAMNTNPIFAEEGSPDEYLFSLMKKNNILAIPLVSNSGQFLRLAHISQLSYEEKYNEEIGLSFAVIMAGGLGTRLRPITNNIPKPMVDIGGVPLLERQINNLSKLNVKRVYIAVNYLSEVIEDYFNDGSEHKIEIRYLKEKDILGTAGALSLIKEKPRKPFLVMNGDVLTSSNFTSLVNFHQKEGADLTIAAFSYNIDIPFGVMENEGSHVIEIKEKPSQNFLCNAGIYILSPRTIEAIPKNKKFNMTDLISHQLKETKQVSIFPIHEYWSDIGTSNDLNKARDFYGDKS